MQSVIEEKSTLTVTEKKFRQINYLVTTLITAWKITRYTYHTLLDLSKNFPAACCYKVCYNLLKFFVKLKHLKQFALL